MMAVVLIDDDAAVCRVFERILTRADIEVVTFTDPERAIEYINANRCQFVICDYRMPTMSGRAVRERIEGDVRFALISGDLSVEVLPGPGIDHVLRKPIPAEELVAFVRGSL